MLKKAGLALALMSSPAVADQMTVDILNQYSFRFSDQGLTSGNGCHDYVQNALALINIQKPFCQLEDIGRYLAKGWKVQHSEEIHYTVQPPEMNRWECKLHSIVCSGKRFYLSSD